MSADLATALLDALDDDALALLAERLAPLLAQRMGPAATGRLLTAREVGEKLGLHERTVSRMAAEGRLEARKVGRGWRFDPERLDVTVRSAGRVAAPARRRPRPPRSDGVAALRALSR